MKRRIALLIAPALFSASCGRSGNVTNSSNTASTLTDDAPSPYGLDAAVARMENETANPGSGAVIAANQSFFDPAWARSLGDASQYDVDAIRRVIFMAKGNQRLQANQNFRFFVAALYDCSQARTAGRNEFDRDRILDAAMQRLNIYLGSQPDTFTWVDHENELGQWNRTTRAFGWTAYNNAALTPVAPETDPVVRPCGSTKALAASDRERSAIRFEYANEQAIKAAVRPIVMDEAAARQYAETHPQRKISVRYTWVSRPDTPGYTVATVGDKIFRPVVSKVEILDPANAAVLSSYAP